MTDTIIAELNAVRVLRRHDGKYGVEDAHGGSIAWRFRTEESAMATAKLLSAENDRIDAYESSTPRNGY